MGERQTKTVRTQRGSPCISDLREMVEGPGVGHKSGRNSQSIYPLGALAAEGGGPPTIVKPSVFQWWGGPGVPGEGPGQQWYSWRTYLGEAIHQLVWKGLSGFTAQMDVPGDNSQG